MAEQVFDLVDYLEQRVTLPAIAIPHLSPAIGTRSEIEAIAQQVRHEWNVPLGPIANVVRLMESRGVIVVRLPSGDSKLDPSKVDAFSRWFGERPLVVLWADKGDKGRSRFDAAHELGHLVMHTDAEPLDREQERQANMFASAFLMPSDAIGASLVRRAPTVRSWDRVLKERRRWGVSAKALLYRSRELGALPDSAYRRAMIAYNQHGIASRDGSELGEPEQPVLLGKALQPLLRRSDLDQVASEALVPRTLLNSVAPSDPTRATSSELLGERKTTSHLTPTWRT